MKILQIFAAVIDINWVQFLLLFSLVAAFDVVEIKVEQVSNPTPSDSGVCNYINKTQIEVNNSSIT